MEYKKKNPPTRAGFDVISDRTDRMNNITISKLIQPRFCISEVDDHLSGFAYLGRKTKRVRMIAWLHLCAINGFAVTRFDALHVGCSCWNTTASEIGTKAGLKLQRRDTTRRTRFSSSTRVCEYWFSQAEIPAVERFLGGFRKVAA